MNPPARESEMIVKIENKAVEDYIKAYEIVASWYCEQELTLECILGQYITKPYLTSYDHFALSLYCRAKSIDNKDFAEWLETPLPGRVTQYLRGRGWLSTPRQENGDIIIDSGDYGDTNEWVGQMIDAVLNQNYSLSRILEYNEFIKTPEYSDLVDKAVAYYRNTGYFKSAIENHDLGMPLRPREYDKLVKNKYFSKVLAAYEKTPDYPVGSLVQFRASHNETGDIEGMDRIFKRAPQGMLVLSNTEQIISACSGAKRYKVIALGDNQPFYIEERYIKRRRKTKAS